MITEIYRELVSKSSANLIDRIRGEFKDLNEQEVYLALFYANEWDQKKAIELLSGLEYEELNAHLQSLFLEVQTVLAYINKRKDEVVALANKALDLNPDAMIACLYLATILSLRKSNYQESIRLYEKFLSVFPDHNGALYGLAWTYIVQGKKNKEALAILDRCRPSIRKSITMFLVPFRGITVQRFIYWLAMVLLYALLPIPALYSFMTVIGILLIFQLLALIYIKNDTFIIFQFFAFQLDSILLYLAYIAMNNIIMSSVGAVGCQKIIRIV
jgi:tetratricopeptide (TPR) repeat protein